MLEREGGELGVRQEVAADVVADDEVPEDAGVVDAGLGDPSRRCGEPVGDPSQATGGENGYGKARGWVAIRRNEVRVCQGRPTR